MRKVEGAFTFICCPLLVRKLGYLSITATVEVKLTLFSTKCLRAKQSINKVLPNFCWYSPKKYLACIQRIQSSLSAFVERCCCFNRNNSFLAPSFSPRFPLPNGFLYLFSSSSLLSFCVSRVINTLQPS